MSTAICLLSMPSEMRANIHMNRFAAVLILSVLGFSMFARAEDETFVSETKTWQQEREQKLRGENGWLTLVGRYSLKEGANTLGVGKDNNIVLPENFTELGPSCLGVITIDSVAGTAKLKLDDKVTMQSEGKSFQGARHFDLSDAKKDWVTLDRMSMYVIVREGKYFLRVADNQSEQRTRFPGCTWFPPNARFRIAAKYVAHSTEQTLVIQNVLGESLQQSSCGYAEFMLDGSTYKLDAIREGEGLFFVFRDATSGETTYGGGRFMDIAKCPADQEEFILDFNRAYNPPCAFSKYTSCPLPPPQNHLKIRIEAGETFGESR
jgi:uncharacterized protein (DUF1684 family)